MPNNEILDKLEADGIVRPSTRARFPDPVAEADPAELMNLVTREELPVPPPAAAAATIQPARTAEDFAQLEQVVAEDKKQEQEAQKAAEAAALEEVEQEEVARTAASMQELEAEANRLNAASTPENRALQFQQQLAAHDAEVDELRNREINPNKFWADRSTGQKILAGLSIFLGALGNQGQGNTALRIIDKAIDRDIEAQKVNRANELAAARDGRQRLQSKIKQAADAMPVGVAQRYRQYQGYKNVLRQIDTFREKNPAKAAEMEDQIRARMQVIGDDIAARVLSGKESIRRDQITGDTNRTFLTAEDDMKFVPGYGLASDLEGAKGLRTAVNDEHKASGMIDELKAMAEGGFENLNLKEKARAKFIAQALVGATRVALFGPGAFTDNEQKRAADIIGNPTNILALDSVEIAKLDELKKFMRGNVEGIAKAQGLGGKRVSSFKPGSK